MHLGRDGLDLGRDAVEGLLQADVVADTVGAALGDELLDVLVGLAGRPQLVADLVAAGRKVYGVSVLRSTLEDVYLEAVGGETS